MRILACGSREWKDADTVRRYLSGYAGNHTLIHGAARGADSIAAEVAKSLGWEVIPYPADWKRFGRAAGPRRNAGMLRTGPDIVIAFHESLATSLGTKDTVTRARGMGIRVEVIGE